MKTSIHKKNVIRFEDLPRDYEALCHLHLPRKIHDRAKYDATAEMAARFAGFEAAISPDQADYFDLLCTLMEAWEKLQVPRQKLTPLERLQHLVEQSTMNGADLSRILGGSRQLGPMVLRGARSITADHARALGKHFEVPAGFFIE